MKTLKVNGRLFKKQNGDWEARTCYGIFPVKSSLLNNKDTSLLHDAFSEFTVDHGIVIDYNLCASEFTDKPIE